MLIQNIDLITHITEINLSFYLRLQKTLELNVIELKYILDTPRNIFNGVVVGFVEQKINHLYFRQ